MENEKPTTIVLCNFGDTCPEVNFYTDQVVITDDFGGKVTLTRKEWKMLQNADEKTAK